jgi:HD-like signal output (HDOD) protein
MKTDNIIRMLDRITDLPTLPTIYTKVNELIQSERASADEIAMVIESDQAISVKILRLVNSSFFGFSRKITKVQQAVVLLGFNTVRNAVLSISVFDSLKSNGESQFDRRAFWKHSIATGVIATSVGRNLGLSQTDEAFPAGVLHDLGKLFLDSYLPQYFNRILKVTQEKGIFIRQAERDVIGICHTELGEYLMERWKLPHVLVEAVALHHSPTIIRSNPQLVALTHIGDALARRLGIGSGGDPLVPEINPFALEELNLTEDDLEAQLPLIEMEMQNSREIFDLVD